MKNIIQTNRRNFIKNASIGVVASLSIPQIVSAASGASSAKKIGLQKNDIILFQGDSITDWFRNKSKTEANTNDGLGSGYALMAASHLLSHNPEKNLTIYNRGISGFKAGQLLSRWDTDCIELKPNVVSILVGVNDFWHRFIPSINYKGTIVDYRSDYRKLLDKTNKELPNTKIIIGEPFGIKGIKAVDEKWYPEFDRYREVARELAHEYNTAFIPYQSIFDKAMESAPGTYWTSDGVHPTVAGAGLMAHAWLETVK